MSKMLSLIVGVSVLALAGTASAGAPLSLTNAQMDVVTAGASSSKSFDYSKNHKSMSYNDENFSGKSKLCDDFTKKEKSKSFDYSKNHKSTSYNDANFSGKSKMYDDFTKKGSSQPGLFVSVANGRMFAPKVK
jgi:hypothetical protein